MGIYEAIQFEREEAARLATCVSCGLKKVESRPLYCTRCMTEFNWCFACRPKPAYDVFCDPCSDSIEDD